jgi:hypothetical protein
MNGGKIPANLDEFNAKKLAEKELSPEEAAAKAEAEAEEER